jgi:hypothetical protein
MKNNTYKKYFDERAKLLAELSTLSLVLHGSWIERYSVCSIASCKCHTGKRHGPRRYLVVNEDGAQKQKYIPNAHVENALKGIKQHHRLQEIVDRITYINLVLMKEVDHDHNT